METDLPTHLETLSSALLQTPTAEGASAALRALAQHRPAGKHVNYLSFIIN